MCLFLFVPRSLVAGGPQLQGPRPWPQAVRGTQEGIQPGADGQRKIHALLDWPQVLRGGLIALRGSVHLQCPCSQRLMGRPRSK